MKAIIVIYINCSGIDNERINEHIRKINIDIDKERFLKEEIEIFIIPTSENTKVECIYPTFIASEQKVKETQETLKSINTLFLDLLQKKNNE